MIMNKIPLCVLCESSATSAFKKTIAVRKLIAKAARSYKPNVDLRNHHRKIIFEIQKLRLAENLCQKIGICVGE